MRRVRLTCIIPGIVALWAGVTFACVATVGAAGPPPPLVAQAATAVLTNSTPTESVPPANPLATAPSASAASGTSLAATPSSTETVDTGSAAAPPEPLPVVDTSSGPSRGQVIITLIGVIGALIVIPLTAFALIRLIATAGR
jgi:hypothetical protein